MHDQLTKDSLQIARLEEQFNFMRETLGNLDKRLELMERSMEAMERQLAEAKGGWRTLVWLGGAAASLGAGISWVMSHVRLQ